MKTYMAFLCLLYSVSLYHHWRLTIVWHWRLHRARTVSLVMIQTYTIEQAQEGHVSLQWWSSLKTYYGLLVLDTNSIVWSLYHHWRLTWPSCACSIVWVCIQTYTIEQDCKSSMMIHLSLQWWYKLTWPIELAL